MGRLEANDLARSCTGSGVSVLLAALTGDLAHYMAASAFQQ